MYIWLASLPGCQWLCSVGRYPWFWISLVQGADFGARSPETCQSPSHSEMCNQGTVCVQAQAGIHSTFTFRCFFTKCCFFTVYREVEVLEAVIHRCPLFLQVVRLPLSPWSRSRLMLHLGGCVFHCVWCVLACPRLWCYIKTPCTSLETCLTSCQCWWMSTVLSSGSHICAWCVQSRTSL